MVCLFMTSCNKLVSGVIMKNISYILLNFIFSLFIVCQTLNAQISRNPDQSRPTSRIPGSNTGVNTPDRSREPVTSKPVTKERNTPPIQVISNPVHANPVSYPEPPVRPPKHYCPPLPPPPPIVEPVTIIDYNPTIVINEPAPIIGDNPVSDVKVNELTIQRLDEALKSNPKDTILYFLRGNAKLVTQDYYGAIQDFSTYLKLVPWDKEAYYKRGLAYLYYGNKKEALIDFQIASELGYNKGDSIIKKYY